MARPALALLAALLLAGCGKAGADEVAVADAWVKLPAVAGRPGAAYFTVTGGAAPARLVAIEGPAARRIELHRSAMAGGHMTMQRLDGVDVAKGAHIVFAPAGDHAMLFGLAPTLRVGDTTRLTFRFERGTAVSVEARVVGAGDDSPY